MGWEPDTPKGGHSVQVLGSEAEGDGTMQGEKLHIGELVGERTRQLRHHPYTGDQALDVV